MFSHISLGTDDLPRACAFYDAVLAPLGLARMVTLPEQGAAGYGGDIARFWITRAFDGRPATPGNGAMVAFEAPSRAAVDATHAAALAAGGRDEGPPGLRPLYSPDYYGAYFRDPGGNKLCVVCRRPEP